MFSFQGTIGNAKHFLYKFCLRKTSFKWFGSLIDLPLIQWRQRDSNSRPPACKAGALPTELCPLDGYVMLLLVVLTSPSALGLPSYGLKWTRTTDLTLIRRAL